MLATHYALSSGGGVPSQRTIWMLSAIALLRLTGRRWPWPHVWLLACAVVGALDLWALMQPAFWLSFVAVGVLSATDSGVLSARSTGVSGRFLQNAREHWVITLTLTPPTLLLFQQNSVVALLANAGAISWVTLVATPLAMAGVIVPPLWHVMAWSVEALALQQQWLARLPIATSLDVGARVVGGCSRRGGGILLAMRLPWSVRLLGMPLLLPVLLWHAPRPPAGEFELLAAGLGKDTAALVRTATHSLLNDAGPRYSQERRRPAGRGAAAACLRRASRCGGAEPSRHRSHRRRGGRAGDAAEGPLDRLDRVRASFAPIAARAALRGRPALCLGRRGLRGAAPAGATTPSTPDRLRCRAYCASAMAARRRCSWVTSSDRRMRRW